MQIKFFCPRWGSENTPWDKFCEKVKEAGFDGVETPVPFDEAGKNEIVGSLKNNGLLLVGQYYQSLEKDFELHKENYKKHLHNIAALNRCLSILKQGKTITQLLRIVSCLT